MDSSLLFLLSWLGLSWERLGSLCWGQLCSYICKILVCIWSSPTHSQSGSAFPSTWLFHVHPGAPGVQPPPICFLATCLPLCPWSWCVLLLGGFSLAPCLVLLIIQSPDKNAKSFKPLSRVINFLLRDLGGFGTSNWTLASSSLLESHNNNYHIVTWLCVCLSVCLPDSLRYWIYKWAMAKPYMTTKL